MASAMGTKTHDGNPCIYTLNTKEIPIKRDSKLRKCVIGSKISCQSEKVIMVVGATGAGKTTLINFLANYILGVKWDTNFRYQLVPDEDEIKKPSQAESQTEWITSYTFYPQKDQIIPYTLTVIDTPGLGDTRGIDRDKEIFQQIREFFSTPSEYGIDQIDAIAFVAQASLARLTERQMYVFDSVLSVFGKDIAENIFLFLTFADRQAPSVLQSIDKARVPYKCYFKFNNCVLYEQKQNKKNRNEKCIQNNSDSDDDDDKDIYNNIVWKMSEKSLTKFYKELQNTASKSITLTANVLKERQTLQTYIEGMFRLIRSCVVNLEMLKKEEEVLRQHKVEMNSTQDFTYTVNVEKKVKRNLVDDHAMVCHNCQFTCHYPCSPVGPKFICSAMKFIAVLRGCGTCPQKCSLEYHENVEFTYEREAVEETRTHNDLQKRYEDAFKKLLKTDELVDAIRKEINAVKNDIKERVGRVRESLKRLEKISLKPNPLTTPEYIYFLIQNEEAGHQAGWEERRATLLKIREEAIILEKIAQCKTDDVEFFSNTTPALVSSEEGKPG